MDTPIIGASKPLELENAVLFTATLIFVNNSNQATRMGFACPPGLYPNPENIVKLVEEAQREALRALKLQTQDLSWRLPTPTEFVRITSGNQNMLAAPKYKEAFSVKLEMEQEVTNDNNSD